MEMSILHIFLLLLTGGLLIVFYIHRKAIRDILDLIPFWRKMYKIERHLQTEKYNYGTHKKQYFLYCPPNTNVKERNHVIIYFHGGGWQFGSPEAFIPTAQVLSDWGFTVLMASHRKLPFYGIRALREDLSLLISKANEVLTKKQIAYKNIIIGGMSSGGHLASLLLLDQSIIQKSKAAHIKIKGAFLQAAPLDLDKMYSSLTLYFMAGRRNTARYQYSNPVQHLQEKPQCPIYLIHGDDDGIVSYECTLSFQKKLNQLEADCVQLEPIPKGGHLIASYWSVEDNAIRKRLKKWLGQFD